MNDNNYYTVQGWMVTRMNLAGNELLAYALIYGFSQDFESRFSGSLDYICKSLNISKNTAKKALNGLLDKNLIIKTDILKNNIKYCEYNCCEKAYKKILGEMLEDKNENNKNKKVKTSTKSNPKNGIAETAMGQNLTRGYSRNCHEGIAETDPNNHVNNYINNHVHEESLELGYFENVFKELGVNFTKFNQTSVKKLLRTLPKEKVINYLKETFENIKNTPGVKDSAKVFSVKISKGERQPIYQAKKAIMANPIIQKVVKKELPIPEPIKVSREYEEFLTFSENRKKETIEKARLKFAEKMGKSALNHEQEKAFNVEGIRNYLIIEVLKEENITQNS